MDIPFNNKVGTKRYMAPELLDESINENIFDCWKRADVYSLGLVYWELARRCEHSQTRAEEYQMPYYQDVNSDPSIEDMKEVVCDRRIRPLIPDAWEQFEVGLAVLFKKNIFILFIQPLKILAKVMKECWFENASARLSALRIKKTLAALRNLRENGILEDPEKKVEAQG